MPKTQKKAHAAIEPLTAVLRPTESGSDMIRNYGKIEAVVEMFEEGPLNIHQAFIRILEIVKGKGVV